MATRQHATYPLQQSRRVAQEEKGRDEEDEKLEQEVAEADDERDRVPPDHRCQIRHAGEPDDQLVEVLEPQLIRRLGQGVLGIHDERRQGPLQIPELFDRERHEDATATDYGRKEGDEHDERRDRSREREPPLRDGHDR